MNSIKNGSINGLDVFDYGDMHSEGVCEIQPHDVLFKVDGKTYYGSQMFFIFPDKTGRYSLENGMKFDVYLQRH